MPTLYFQYLTTILRSLKSNNINFIKSVKLIKANLLGVLSIILASIQNSKVVAYGMRKLSFREILQIICSLNLRLPLCLLPMLKAQWKLDELSTVRRIKCASRCRKRIYKIKSTSSLKFRMMPVKVER